MAYTWKPSRQSYVGSNGQRVSAARVREWINTATENSKQELAAITRQLADGKINASEWYFQMLDELKPGHMAMTQMASGGRNNVGRTELGRLGARMREQTGYLRDLANAVDSGDVEANDALVARAQNFASSYIGTYEGIRRGNHKDVGFTEEKNVLSPADHCDECRELTAQGWVEIGTLPAPGDRTCLFNCRCALIYQ